MYEVDVNCSGFVLQYHIINILELTHRSVFYEGCFSHQIPSRAPRGSCNSVLDWISGCENNAGVWCVVIRKADFVCEVLDGVRLRQTEI